MYRSGRGQNIRGGAGFGFKGSSPPWPYIGRGRGGLPRCNYYLSNRGNAPSSIQNVQPEQEINSLKDQAEVIKKELDSIESRIRDLENKN